MMEARRDFRELAAEVDELERDNRLLANEIRALRSDPLVIERRAREVLGMAMPDEISLQIRPTEKN